MAAGALTQASPFKGGRSGLDLRVRLTPRSSGDRIEGLWESAEGSAIAARVRAAPSAGQANDALVRLVADWLGVPKSCVALTAGQKSRIKTVTISGDTGVLQRMVENLLAQNPAGAIKAHKS